MFKTKNWFGIVLASSVLVSLADDAAPAKETAEKKSSELPAWNTLDRWSFQAGVAFITESTIDDIIVGEGERATGADEGEIYLLEASYKLAAFQPQIGRFQPRIDLQLPLVLGLVNEHERDDLWLQYNAGVTLRWKSFPWNEWLYTNLETGVGLTYSQYVIATERVRHPERERSHVEIYWPVQLMLALPKHPQHQLSLFLHHHSGGGMFHTGGANSLGLGYRYVPGEK
jgi:hypothetical protein